MKKDLIWSAFAIIVALVMFVVVACASGANPPPSASTPSGTAQPGTGPEAGQKRPAADGPRPELLHELPPVLMAAALSPLAKNDTEVQALLDKVIADMPVIPQDETARNTAFQQFVQAERNGDADAVTKARADLNAANSKLVADARQLYQQDVVPLRERIRELRSNRGGAAPEAAQHSANAANPHTPPSEN
jgi:hypothetical protein